MRQRIQRGMVVPLIEKLKRRYGTAVLEKSTAHLTVRGPGWLSRYSESLRTRRSGD